MARASVANAGVEGRSASWLPVPARQASKPGYRACRRVQGLCHPGRDALRALTVTHAPGAIFEWQAFTIAQDEITRFVQENAQSAVLNPVVGHGAAIDTTGLVAPALGMSDRSPSRCRTAFALLYVR